MLTFEQTSLWKRTLASREHDPHAEERERLRAALLSMRSRAEELVKLIPLDCKGLTVHDVSHLDALWEMADLIAGDQYELNPSEAFVFGAAVLLHDAGMTVAAYPGGTSDLAQTTEWRDIAHTILQKDGIEPSFELIANPPPEKLPEITFLVLRAIHARAAEQLVNAQWPLPGTSDSVRLLEDLQLRTAFGSSIGRIAHSHNWDIARLSQSLRISVGAASGTPPQWTINELALACLLRCADAAHMDNTRAPSMALALTRPKGVSLEHWKFQNKLNKPTMSSGALIYSSGQDFDLKDAQAWWLCFDTIKMLNRELQSSNALLEDSGLRSFQARRVYGAESPAILARQVIANGWKPVDAEIRVSDPIHLAKTLGGANLYSDTVLDPIRELLQNAVDAVHARRKIQGRSQDWGRVKLAIESQSDQLWVHVDDNGIGMSEKTLVGPLLDFGRSFWASPEVRQEWPGLESAGLHPIGKFGIGFFSIFLLGDNVRVVSKRYDAGEAEARVLEFATIDQRPLVRAAKKGELLPDYNTRVSVRIDETRINPSAEGAVPIRKRLMGLLPSLQTLLCGVDVEITIETPADKCVHAANWTTIDAEKFLNEFLARVPNQERMRLIIGHAALLTVIEDPDGRVYGRAALRLYNVRSGGRNTTEGISVGGFVRLQDIRNISANVVGIVAGDTQNAARSIAKCTVPESVLASWATKQAASIEHRRYDLEELLGAAHGVYELGGDPGELPFCFCGGEFVPLARFLDVAGRFRKIHLMLEVGYQESFKWLPISGLKTEILTKDLKKNVCSFIWGQRYASMGLFEDDELNREIYQDGGGEITMDQIDEGSDTLRNVVSVVSSKWKSDCTLKIEMLQVYEVNYFNPPSPHWVLSISPVAK